MRSRRWRLGPALLVVLAGLVVLSGCSSYPTKLGILHGGHIKREHGKPMEGGYYENFDPAAVTRVETSPALRLRASSLRAREATRGGDGLLLRALFAELSGDRAGALTMLEGAEGEAEAALRGALGEGEQSGG